MKYYLLSVLLFWSAISFGQNIKVTATVSSSQVAVGEQFEISFSTNGNPDAFEPPTFAGFQVVGGPNQSSSYSSINGQTTASISVSYVLVALKEGEFTIGTSIMVIGGKQYKSNIIRMTVTKGKAAPQQQARSGPAGGQNDRMSTGNSSDISKQLFMRAIANKTNVYQGEQIAVTYKLYANIGIVGNTPDKLPDFNGFWSQEIKNNNGNVDWKEEVYNGQRYHVAVLKEIILFPERFGKLTLDPLIMTFVVRKNVPSNDPIEQFFGGGSYEDVKYKIKTAPVAINVKPLPDAGKPEGFEGAVGQFSIDANVDKSSLKANEALNYTLKISGSGNLKLLKAPTVNFPADLEKYDPKINDRITESLSGVSGTREYTYLLIPRHEGNYTIEPLKFSYFNPATEKYVTLNAASFDLKVAKGAPGSNVTAYSSGNQQDIKMLAKDIAYIKTDTSGLHQKDSVFYGSAAYYALMCLGPLLFVGALAYRKQYRENNKDQVKVKGRNANKIAAKHLANAQKQLLAGDKTLFYQDVYKGLYQYLSDKFNIPAAELNKDNITETLRNASVKEPLINQLTDTLDLCEMARYAPVTGIAEQEVFDKAKSIINDIENNA
ncbi:BatD family protein [Pedobacter nyackensis]|uniref:BatD family protein n=1 Tax=Pedobacter nyackensis TaxID=475255 RepID=UPI00292FA76C|nr:BatD family protein [Pedobacter nyackensis]